MALPAFAAERRAAAPYQRSPAAGDRAASRWSSAAATGQTDGLTDRHRAVTLTLLRMQRGQSMSMSIKNFQRG